MPQIEWNKSYELGFKKIDEHHKHLIELINKSRDSASSTVNSDSNCTVLDELFEYARYHFAAEEYWMRVNKYPKLALHRVEHEIFSKKVAEFKTDFYKGSANLAHEVPKYLTNWVIDHILNRDSDFVRFAVENFKEIEG